MIHRISTTDPITLRDIPDPYGLPYIVESDADGDVTIYFESQQTRQMYMNMQVENSAQDSSENMNSMETKGV
jgi:hypothetical protein